MSQTQMVAASSSVLSVQEVHACLVGSADSVSG